LILAVEVIRKLNIPFGVVINRSDVGDNKVDLYCEKENIPILMKIPFKREIAESYSKGEMLINTEPKYSIDFVNLYNDIKNIAESKKV